MKLFIYGNIDEFESPTFYEKKNEPGNYFNQLRKKLCDIDSKDVTFFPRIHGKKLKEAYNGCDLFVSMSLYHDEDFGYSPIEALCCGTPALLTAWGGYHDFKNKKLNEKSIALVKVNYTKNSLIINDKEAETSLIKSIATSKRSQLASKRYQRFYSIETNTERYSLILNRKFGPFSGFSKDFIKLSLSMYFKQSVDLRLYRKFYQAFWSK